MGNAARSIVVILNAKSGAKPAEADAVAAAFQKANVDARIVTLAEGQSPAALARDVSANAGRGGATQHVIVAGGGDGTVSSVAGAVAGTDVALGVLPLGTLNHFAKDLKIPIDLDEAAAVIARGRIVRVDVARVNDRLFVNNSSIGVYPTLVAIRETYQHRGHRKWIAMALALVNLPRLHRGVPVRITVAGSERTVRTPFVFVGNGEYTIDGLSLGTRAAMDAGRLVTYLAPRVRVRELPLMLLRSLAGRSRTAGFEIIDAPDLRVEPLGRRPMRIALDGELATLTSPLSYRTWPGALLVCAPDA